MKKYFILITSLLYLGCSIGKIENDLAIENLKGKVKAVIDTSFFYYSSAENLLDSVATINASYEKNGIIKYNDLGNRLETDYFKQESNFNKIVDYDSVGNYVDQNYFAKKIKHTFKYDDEMNLVEVGFYDFKGTYLNSVDKYDILGHPLETIVYNPDGSLSHTNTFKCEYDSMGNWISIIVFENHIPYSLIKRKIIYY